MDWNRITNAAASFARSLVLGTVAIITVGGRDAIPDDWKGWLILTCLALDSAYNKYSSSSRLLAPDRKVWSEDEKRAALGLVPKRPTD